MLFLEVGKIYKTRKGSIAKVTEQYADDTLFIADHFEDDVNKRSNWFFHGSDGRAQQDGSESSHDLVGELGKNNN